MGHYYVLGKYSSRVIFFKGQHRNLVAFSFFYIQWLISLERFQQSFTYALQAALYSLGCLLCCFLCFFAYFYYLIF